MMAIVESLAQKLEMTKMKLTVFKTNSTALDFYRKSLGYVIDRSSPSQWRIHTECYEILSKDLGVAAAKKTTATPRAAIRKT